MIAAQEDRETALVREKAALRRGQRALTVSAGLFACVVLGVLGWYNQQFLMEQYQWHLVMHPSVLTAEEEKEKAANPGSNFKECANGCPTMIVVPACRFVMGSPESEEGRETFNDSVESKGTESPLHDVTIAKPFAVSKYAVTFAEWDACVSAGACIIGRDRWGRANRPAIYISWEDAKQYVAWLSRATGKQYRLLTEAEWEYAARAGSTTAYSWGDHIGHRKANCKGCGSEWDAKQTAPVGSFEPNAFGLYDMHGNVFQWVEDLWHRNYNGAPKDGSAWTTDAYSNLIAVVRGGSWNYDPRQLRAAHPPSDHRLPLR
jgi:formylglycine-generating enzyme required for sulfatase activity